LLSAARPDLALAATSKALTADPSLIIPRFIEIEALRFLNRKTEALTALKSLEALLASQNDEAGQSLKARAALLKAQLDAEK